MMNYIAIDESHIQMEFGILGDVSSYQTYPSGELESVKLAGKNMVVTHAGELVPAYTEEPRRKNKPSVEFHKNGIVKSVMLEEQTEIETPIETLPAEFVTFYPTGEMHKVFVSDGQISGFWSEENEKQFNIPLSFDLGFTSFRACTNGICFYKSGNIKSITLYPNETIVVGSPMGEIETGIGFSLYETGKLQSIEPMNPLPLYTPIGNFTAFDPGANGIYADSNSLVFDEQDRLIAFSTVEDRVLVQTEEEEFLILAPQEKPHPLYDDQKILSAMNIIFDYDSDEVLIQNENTYTFPMQTTGFTIQKIPQATIGCTPADCASCLLCNSHSSVG